MDLLKPFKAVKKKLEEIMDSMEKKQAEDMKLRKWKTKLNDCMNSHSGFRYKAAEWDAQYHGSKNVKALTSNNFRGTAGDEDEGQTKKARQVVNITMQLIESQIDITSPKPRVDAVEGKEDLERRKMIEGMLSYMSEGPEMQKINSENERIVKKNSIAVFKVIYNPDKGGRSFRGKIEIANPHPINVIPQPGVYKIEDMDYIFHIENRTVSQVCRMYGEEFEEELDGESAEFYYLEDLSNVEKNSTANQNGMVSVVECWYKDKDGDVGLLVWANDVILKDMPKFYYKRDEDGNILYEEEVATENETVTVEVKVPKEFPFVIWYNIPVEKCYYGKSDPDIISDQQEGIKKMLSNEEEKQLKGNTKIFVREGTGIKDKITNAVTQIIEVDDPNGDIKVVDLKTPDASLVNLYTLYVQAAKDCLGITEASQGRAENENLSGKALQLLAQNTQGRMGIKQFEKYIAYSKLYRLVYEFLIAFYDDKIPYRVEGTGNDPEFGVFDKGLLIKQDAAGEWYYPEFDIYIEADQGLSRDKNFIMQVADKAVESQAADAIDYWTIMSSIGFPYAQFILDRAKEKQAKAEEMAMMQTQQEADLKQQDLALKQKAIENKTPVVSGPQSEPQVDTEKVAAAIGKLSPEEQQHFFSMDEKGQMDVINKIMNGEVE